MAKQGYRPDNPPAERVPFIARRMLRQFERVYEAIDNRRAHRYTYETVDPDISQRTGMDPDPNDLYAQADRYQSREIAIVGKRLVDRICENPWQLNMQAPDETQALEKAANRIGQVLSSWGMEIEDRQQLSIQRAMADNIVYDKGYAILHTRLCEDLWPEIDWIPSDEDAGMSTEEKDYTCPGCGGEGMGEDGEVCPQCEGEGVIKRPMLTLKGKANTYVTQVQYEYAKRGSPWTWEVVDPRECAWQEDHDPRGGVRRFLRHREVLLDDYCDDLEEAGEASVKVERLRSAMSAPGDRHTNVTNDTPSSDDFEGVRVVVYQLWTRSHLYEWMEGQGHTGDDARMIKHGEHGYPRIPFRVVAPRRTNHADPMWRFECVMDDMYAVKPWADKQITLMGAIMANTAQPELSEYLEDSSKAPYLPDGVPADGNSNGTVAGRQPYPGLKTEVISPPMPPSVPQFWELLKGELERARPETGDVDIGQTSQAWAIRLGQAQSGKGPRTDIREHKEAIDWKFQLWLDTHEQRGLRMVAFGRDKESRRVTSSQPIVIEASEIAFNEPNTFINAVSAAEKQMEVEHARGLLQEQLITLPDFYKIMGAKDPDDEAMRVRVYWITQPYADQMVQGKLAERMGSQFVIGLNGEMTNAAGQNVSPEQVLQAKGYQPGGGVPAAAPAPGGGSGGPSAHPPGLAQLRGQAAGMPGLPGLNVPGAGVNPLPGIPAGV